MDNSLERILMCTKAVEIQALWKQEDADLIFVDGRHAHFQVPSGERVVRSQGAENPHILWEDSYLFACHCIAAVPINSIIWLPYQYQLQEMLEDSFGVNPFATFSIFHCTINSWKAKYILQFNSMEQLWLAFVMKENFGKIWNGESWITNKK